MKIIFYIILNIISTVVYAQTKLEEYIEMQDTSDLVGKQLTRYFSISQGEIKPNRKEIICNYLNRKLRFMKNDSCSFKVELNNMTKNDGFHLQVVLSVNHKSKLYKYIIGEWHHWARDSYTDGFKKVNSYIISDHKIKIVSSLSYADFENDNEVLLRKDSLILDLNNPVVTEIFSVK